MSKIISLLKKVWSWIKRNWKWLLFPVGILLTLFGYIAGRRKTIPPSDPPDLGKEGEDALNQTIAADEERDKMLEELKKKNQERLHTLSVEQQKELDELKSKSLEEVVAWFDNI